MDLIPSFFTSTGEGIGPRTIDETIDPQLVFPPNQNIYVGMFDNTTIYNIANFPEFRLRIYDGATWTAFTMPQGTFPDIVSVNDFFEKLQESLSLVTGTSYAFTFTTNLSLQRTVLTFDNTTFPNVQVDLNPTPISSSTVNLAYKLGFTNDFATPFIAQGAVQAEYTGAYESKISSFLDKGIFLVASGDLRNCEAILNNDRYSNVLYRIPIPADVRIGDVIYSNPNSILFVPLNSDKIQNVKLRYMLLNDNRELEDAVFTGGNNSCTLVFKIV